MNRRSRQGVVLASAVAGMVLLCGAVRGEAEEGGDEKRREHRIVVVSGEDDGGGELVREMVLTGGPGSAMDLLHGWTGGGFLGVELAALTPELRAHFGAPEDAGVMVARVTEESPAWRSGVQVGDIVVAVGGEDVASPADLAREVRARGGETVTLEVWRAGSVERLDVTLEEREASWPAGLGPPHWRGARCEREDCRIVVRCDAAGECECTVDGESRDCAELEEDGDEGR